jgi:hypothetical protein
MALRADNRRQTKRQRAHLASGSIREARPRAPCLPAPAGKRGTPIDGLRGGARFEPVSFRWGALLVRVSAGPQWTVVRPSLPKPLSLRQRSLFWLPRVLAAHVQIAADAPGLDVGGLFEARPPIDERGQLQETPESKSRSAAIAGLCMCSESVGPRSRGISQPASSRRMRRGRKPAKRRMLVNVLGHRQIPRK